MPKTKDIKENSDSVIEKMFRVGAHYGYSKTRRHPSLSKYIYATKNKSDIIDLEKTSMLLDKACEFVKKLGAQGKVIIFVVSISICYTVVSNPSPMDSFLN